MAQSIEQLDFSDYDVVLCSSSWFAHGAITKPETKFIVYCHSPARYMWDWTNEYKKDIWANSGIKWYILNKLLLKLRQWDFIASKRADITIANSKNTQNRITKYYRKKSEILYPPVETTRFWITTSKESEYNDYYIIISALTEFKKIDIAINAFNKMPEKKLVIIWQWDYKSELERQANDNIIFTWAKYSDELVSLVQNSNWLIFPWEEDFWIVPIEVMAAWKPIFAYNWWWLTETVIKWITWEFFNDKNWIDFIENFKIFDKNNLNWKYLAKNCIKQANLFSENKFENRIKELVEKG
jgi:glycosyltransferase involved in cell wall biosynthesis